MFDRFGISEMGSSEGTKYFSVSTEHSPFKAPLNSTRVEVECKVRNKPFNPILPILLYIEANNGSILLTRNKPILRACNEEVGIKFKRSNSKNFTLNPEMNPANFQFLG